MTNKLLKELISKHLDTSNQNNNLDEFLREIDRVLCEKDEIIEEVSSTKCAFLDNIPFQGWIKDLDGKFIAVNEAFANNYNKKPEEIIGKTDFDICSEELAIKYLNEDKDVIESRKVFYNIEKTFDDKDQEIWFESYKKPFLNSKNIIAGTTGYARNITSQKQNEEAVNQSEQRFKSIVDNIQDGITIVENGQIIFCNDRITEITGYSKIEYRNLPINILIDISDKNRIHEIIGKAKQTGKKIKELDFWIKRKDGTKKYVSNRYTYFKRGNKEGRHIITTDITARKIAEDKLKHSETIFRSFFELPLTGIAITKPNMEWVEVNDKLCKILGYNKKDFQHISWKDLTPEEDKEFHENQLFKKVASGEMDGTTIEKRYIRKDGSLIHAFICTSCMRDENGKVQYFFSMIDDITYKVQIEDQLERLMKRLENINVELEKKVKEEVKKNREKDLMLAQKSKHAALGEMIGNIAHQWRQPLNAVGLIIQNIEEAFDFGELDEKYLKDNVKKSMELIEFMSQTIDDFRQFYRLDKIVQEFNIKEIVKKAVSFVEASFNNQNIKISVEEFDDIIIKGYPNEYAQVLLNLLNNSRDALLKSEPEFPEITIGCIVVNKKSRLEIIDNGTGIPKKLIDKIFEPYYTTKEASKGTGLGLYMSKTIIEHNMKGKLYAENLVNGAKFTIEI